MFLVFPLQSKPDWRRPPWCTLLLIVINVWVYFGPQSQEAARIEDARAFYLRSSLPAIELPLYLQSLEARTDTQTNPQATRKANAVRALIDARQWAPVLTLMEQDAAFSRSIRQGRLLAKDAPQWQAWQDDRAKYAQRRGEAFTLHWASVPSDSRLETLFTSIFLHGSFSHLFGNMVFLFAFGYTVELALGAPLFLLFYVLSGLAGAAADVGVRAGSEIAGLGASGAISGLMAMYSALFGRQRIQFFYQFLFYFDYVRAPAIILLPAWIATELLQQVLNPNGGVAFMAHAGGLAAGGLLIFLYQRLGRDHAKAAVARLQAPEAPEDSFEQDMAQGIELLQKMRFAEARRLYVRLSEARPDQVDVLRACHSLVKADPGHNDFHRCVHRIASIAQPDAETLAWMAEVFEDYLARAQPRPMLSARRLTVLGIKLARGGHLKAGLKAEALATGLDPQQAELAVLRLGLVAGLLRAQRRPEAEAMAKRLRAAHPDAQEVRMAAQLLA